MEGCTTTTPQGSTPFSSLFEAAPPGPPPSLLLPCPPPRARNNPPPPPPLFQKKQPGEKKRRWRAFLPPPSLLLPLCPPPAHTHTHIAFFPAISLSLSQAPTQASLSSRLSSLLKPTPNPHPTHKTPPLDHTHKKHAPFPKRGLSRALDVARAHTSTRGCVFWGGRRGGSTKRRSLETNATFFCFWGLKTPVFLPCTRPPRTANSPTHHQPLPLPRNSSRAPFWSARAGARLLARPPRKGALSPSPPPPRALPNAAQQPAALRAALSTAS